MTNLQMANNTWGRWIANILQPVFKEGQVANRSYV
jgi:hypothetical protein